MALNAGVSNPNTTVKGLAFGLLTANNCIRGRIEQPDADIFQIMSSFCINGRIFYSAENPTTSSLHLNFRLKIEHGATRAPFSIKYREDKRTGENKYCTNNMMPLFAFYTL